MAPMFDRTILCLLAFSWLALGAGAGARLSVHPAAWFVFACALKLIALGLYFLGSAISRRRRARTRVVVDKDRAARRGRW